MSSYLEKLNLDLLEQFRGRPNTLELISALARQLDELEQVLGELLSKRQLSKAQGKQLDGIGEIVGLERQKAQELANSLYKDVPFNDELYRLLLMRQIMKNTSNCTYPQNIKILKMLWGKTPIYYAEEPDNPATMFFSFNALDEKGQAVALGRVPTIHAGGVLVKFSYLLSFALEVGKKISQYNYYPPQCNTLLCGEGEG